MINLIFAVSGKWKKNQPQIYWKKIKFTYFGRTDVGGGKNFAFVSVNIDLTLALLIISMNSFVLLEWIGVSLITCKIKITLCT